MNQVQATFTKTLKEFLREKATLFWTIAWPIIWVLLGSFAYAADAPEDVLPFVRGAITIPMMVFALMIAGMANIPGNIGEDRERGLLARLKSMPVSPWKDFSGRFLALLTFSCIAVILVGVVGYSIGARVSGSLGDGFKSVALLLVAISASAGIGMLIGTFVKNVHGATMTGVGVSVLSAAVSGVMVPYSALPGVLQAFARVYPMSSVNSMVTYLMVGEEYAGYNPLTAGQVAFTVAVAVILLAAGLVAYSRFCWKRE
jgi:ABC-type multidrug transport system permease subunit